MCIRDRVHVARRWPATAVIRVVERVPAASVRTPDGIVLVDKTARVLERVAAAPPDLHPVTRPHHPTTAQSGKMADGAAVFRPFRSPVKYRQSVPPAAGAPFA